MFHNRQRQGMESQDLLTIFIRHEQMRVAAMFRHQASLGRELLQNQLDFLSQHTHGRVATKLFRHQHSLGRELQELVDIFIRHEQMRVAAMFRHQHSLGRELLQNPLDGLSQHKRLRVETKLFRHQHSLGRELQELVDIFIRHERLRVAAMFRQQSGDIS